MPRWSSRRRSRRWNHRPASELAIVCTSTLELGVDLPNVDRVVQVGPPPSVNSLVQRMGRSGRRPGRTPELAIVVDTPEDETTARHQLARARTGDLDTPPLLEREPRLLEQQLLARTAAAQLARQDLRTTDLLASLTTLPGLRDFSAADREAALAALMARDRLREVGGCLVMGDAPAEWWRVGTVFEGVDRAAIA